MIRTRVWFFSYTELLLERTLIVSTGEKVRHTAIHYSIHWTLDWEFSVFWFFCFFDFLFFLEIRKVMMSFYQIISISSFYSVSKNEEKISNSYILKSLQSNGWTEGWTEDWGLRVSPIYTIHKRQWEDTVTVRLFCTNYWLFNFLMTGAFFW